VLFASDARELPEPSADPACGFYWTEGIRGLGWAVDAVPTLKGGSTIGIPSPPAILLPSGDIVKPDLRDAERMQGFEPDWTKPAEAVVRASHRWKLVGNAVTVDVAHWIGEKLMFPGIYHSKRDAKLLPGSKWPKAAWNVGDARHAAVVSPYPVKRRSTPLEKFLHFPKAPLSEKATAGFLSRVEQSSLNFPRGFKRALRDHLKKVSRPLSA
jgi:DNA (cytosine-5)-methyltransferase 1